ncbi:MAG TPA: tripartite tricarboxylate transporter substrate-binding protein [Xanthobacteraceae bacterium]|jgi:tripartite-type tricarboxylate transporter receptor subunit TctC|nr:tripartite tricarboxylate transporter substrate-binding protein [Xanthobacteraceae bacterium]
MGARKKSADGYAFAGSVCRYVGILLAALFALSTRAVDAQSGYPSRPVQLIISYGAGSTGDVSMRILMEQLTAKLGQPFLVVNKPGAGGVAAAQAAEATAPDGYTLLLTGNSSTISVALFKSLPYNILTDFDPVTMVANFDMVVLVKAGSPLKSVQDIVAYAKAHPGKLNMGTLAPGTTQYLAAELFKIATGTDVATVPFHTSPDMMTALLRGDVDVDFEFFAPIQAMLADHKVVPLATTGKTRADFLPDIPTVMESGIADFDVTSWNGIVAPAGTPRPIIDKLSLTTIEALQAPSVQDAGRRLGMEMRGSTPEQLTARLKNDIAKWTDVVEKAHIPKMD